MPGYFIRTAAGIQPVRDWYIKMLGDSSSNTSHAMTAATAGGGSKGYENGNGAIGQPAYGSLSPLSAGGIEVRGLTWAQGAANEPTLVYLGPAGGAGTPLPPDDDTSFSRIDITGTFADGAGTRTLVRSSADFTGGGSNGTRQWQFRNAKAAKFLSGNAYTAVVQRSGSVGPVIKQVKEAYIRTASGIQKYWPAAPVETNHTMVAGVDSPEPNTGYNAFPVYGSMTPFVSGTFNWQSLVTFSATNRLTVVWADAAAANIVGNTDATFQKLQITGVFNDSGGSSVMWEILRSAGTYSNFGFTAAWDYATSRKFINGNSYAVKVFRV